MSNAVLKSWWYLSAFYALSALLKIESDHSLEEGKKIDNLLFSLFSRLYLI